jgi:hypothetical protein
MIEKFSNNNNYILEDVPNSVKFYNRKKWLQKKLSLLDEEKFLVFSSKSKLLIVFLKDNEEYWLPLEKSKFFLEIAKDNGKNTFLIEETDFGFNYYVIIKGFLVCYTQDEAYAKEVIEKNRSKTKLKTIAICESDYIKSCDKLILYSQIASKIGYQYLQNIKNNNSLAYVNERDEADKDDLFYYWYNKIRNNNKFKKNIVKIGLVACSIVFLSLGIFYKRKAEALNQEIEKILKEMKKDDANN